MFSLAVSLSENIYISASVNLIQYLKICSSFVTSLQIAVSDLLCKKVQFNLQETLHFSPSTVFRLCCFFFFF